ncbi:TonB-dependent receptor [Flavobacterium sp. I3-2]|uniref:TonB-dependent receptor n=1 Tax=Flavobacterium sp. I3-2 TaxID=2748319 RepID=UPI0015AB8948|nr:TonB-dependent receptor [Flavobacterium sp. I3-2]
MNRKYILASFLFTLQCFSQTGNLKGIISSDKTFLENANVKIQNSEILIFSDQNGYYEIQNIPVGKQIIQVNYIGFQSQSQTIEILEGQTIELNFELLDDYLGLEEMVITSTRKQVPVYKAPVVVSRINSKTFETTQSLALSESLNFSPGLRMETNCQNCGFTQVRMNGLEGPYTQILINSRPIFSALMGVYGLDMLPTNMIDRVEVIRGGGSALYGGNAIAGTINILTKDPIKNSFSIGSNLAFTDYKVPDRTINVNGSVVSEDLNKGMSFYAYNRDRKPWDANGDGFSEQTLLKNTTFGFDAFWQTSDLSKLKINLFNINEFRRGGNKFELPAHQTDITEQLDHKILGGAISFEQASADLKHKFSVFSSAQTANRDSYYGGGGRILEIGDQLTEQDITAINAYGNSNDISIVTGANYGYEINNKYNILAGVDYNFNQVEDKMPGYNRSIDQKVGTLGFYGQIEMMPLEKFTFLVGARYDYVNINGRYDFDIEKSDDQKTLNAFVPRITAMYEVTDYLKIRASYSQGYRAPQAFNEDLHIETVGGAASFTVLSPDLKTEKSNSINASLNFSKNLGDVQTNIILEGFTTKLNDVFITADAKELPSGVSVLTKRNGSGARVTGLNLEASFALSRAFNLQLGGTVQNAKYDETEELWKSKDETEIVGTKNMLRTPNTYGYYTLSYNPIKPLTLSLSGVYTGKMDVTHMVDPETERTVIKRTKDFFENNIRVAYDFDFKDNCIQIYTGIQNMFHAYQKDFDRGALRDANFIYGPSRPQTFFFGAKYTLN